MTIDYVTRLIDVYDMYSNI